MMSKKQLKRKNVYVSEEIDEFLKKESEKTGLTQSAIILISINAYKQQVEVPQYLSTAESLLQEIRRKNANDNSVLGLLDEYQSD